MRIYLMIVNKNVHKMIVIKNVIYQLLLGMRYINVVENIV